MVKVNKQEISVALTDSEFNAMRFSMGWRNLFRNRRGRQHHYRGFISIFHIGGRFDGRVDLSNVRL
jgi:hypothetical protein